MTNDHVSPTERLRAAEKVSDRLADEIFAPRSEGEKLGDCILNWLLWIAVICLIGYDVVQKGWL